MTLTFAEWLVHWGEERLAEIMEERRESGARFYQSGMEDARAWTHPVWEIIPGAHWVESMPDWRSAWLSIGGRVFHGRLLAFKHSPVWCRFPKILADATGLPHPPFARSSCMAVRELCADEAIELGMMTSEAHGHRMPRPMRRHLEDEAKNFTPEQLAQMVAELRADQGYLPGETRAQRRARRLAEEVARANELYTLRR